MMTVADNQAGLPEDRRWVLSFRVHHRSADLTALAERIGDAFGMDPHVLWRVGDPMPHAKPPGQVRTRSYCSVHWDNQGESLVEALDAALDALAPLSADLAGIFASGGRLDFFTGLFVERSMGIELPPMLLARLGEARIELQLDIYGGPRNTSPDIAGT